MVGENVCNSPLPAEKLPECWNQEERMSALFSPFRSKSVNPQDWVSKYKFWNDLIYEWLAHTMQCSFSIVDLNQAFKRKGCAPLCLLTVIEELSRNNEIIQETDFFKEPCETWTAWSIDIFVKRPISWSFSKMKNYIVGEKTNNIETRYVHLRIVRELGDVILSIAEVKKDNILFPISEIMEHCKSKTKKQISESTVRLTLEWLKQKKKVAFKKSSNPNSELLVKISIQTNEITEVEEGMYKLTKQENKLIKEIELMEQEKLNIVNEAKLYLGKELRQMAKMRLKRKMELEKRIEKRAQALANLRVLITNIEDAHSNSAVLSAYKTGSDVLKKIGQNGNLTEYKVRDVMDDINEALEENKEIDSVLSETLNTDSDAELERELAELLEEDNEIEVSTAVSDSNSEIEKLKQRLQDLRMEGLVSPGKDVAALPSVPSNKEKTLKELECL